jgi:apolipoprotein N-acyltransferase
MTGEKIQRWQLGAASLSGILLTVAFPAMGISWLAWFALVPLFFSLQTSSIRNAFCLGLVTGSVHYLSLLYWVAYTVKVYGQLPWLLSVPVLFLLAIYLSLYVGAFGAMLVCLCQRPRWAILLIPTLWVATEYLRSTLFSGFPWELAGYSQFAHLELIQISDICGVYGVSFLVVLGNAALFFLLLYFKGGLWQGTPVKKSFAMVGVLFFAAALVFTWSYGRYRIKHLDDLVLTSPRSQIAVIQGNIDQTRKWDKAFQMETTQTYLKLSRQAQKDHPALVVWPETSTPFYLFYNIKFSGMVLDTIAESNADFLIGSPAFEAGSGSEDYFNSAYLIQPDGSVAGQYDKVHLVPFGEYVPFKKLLPFIGKMVAQVGDFKPGVKGDTLSWKDHALGVQICYEIIFPGLSRAMVANGASLLVNITNDAWFARTSAPYQHFSMAIFRAVENRRSLVRCANTGISGFIDPVGRVISKTPLFAEAVLSESIPLIKIKTFYTRFGDSFARVCLVICFGLLLRYYRAKIKLNRNREPIPRE